LSTLAHGPSVLLLDEPSSGIAQREAEAFAELAREQIPRRLRACLRARDVALHVP